MEAQHHEASNGAVPVVMRPQKAHKSLEVICYSLISNISPQTSAASPFAQTNTGEIQSEANSPRWSRNELTSVKPLSVSRAAHGKTAE